MIDPRLYDRYVTVKPRLETCVAMPGGILDVGFELFFERRPLYLAQLLTMARFWAGEVQRA